MEVKRARKEKQLLGDALGWMDGLIMDFRIRGLRARLPRRKKKNNTLDRCLRVSYLEAQP